MERSRFLWKVCYWSGAGAAFREIDITLLTDKLLISTSGMERGF